MGAAAFIYSIQDLPANEVRSNGTLQRLPRTTDLQPLLSGKYSTIVSGDTHGTVANGGNDGIADLARSVEHGVDEVCA